MDTDSSDSTLPSPYFHDESCAVRLWVRDASGTAVGAILRAYLLHHRYRGATDGSDALQVYQAHRSEIDAAVLRRIAAGSREPVLLREGDFEQRPRNDPATSV